VIAGLGSAVCFRESYPSVVSSRLLMSSIALNSRIHRVVVHARGAVVTRAITLPSSLPAESCELVATGITPLAEPASFRAIAKGSRQVISVLARFVVPEGPAKLGSAAERVQAAEAARVALREERAHVMGRRNQIAGVQFNLGMDRRFHQANARSRIADALAMTRLVQDELAVLDARIATLDRSIEQAERAVDAARIAEVQARSAELEGASRPTLSCHVRLGSGQTPPEVLEIEYVVLAARFWPTYKAWLTKGATRVRIELDALVAQDSGEDWTNVEMSLSTADLVHDARLPELPSLRFGRATPPQKRGYRAPPPGLETMFEAYDAAMEKAPQPPKPSIDALRSTEAAPPPLGPPPKPSAFGAPPTMQATPGAMPAPASTITLDTMGGAEATPLGLWPEKAKGRARAISADSFSAARSGAMPPPQGLDKAKKTKVTFGAVPPLSLAAGPGGGGYAAPLSAMLEEVPDTLMDPETALSIELDDAWLNFDALVLPDGDKLRRGKLTRLPDDSVRLEASQARYRIETLPNPAWTKDPLVSRGQFDHRYEAAGRGDIPSNGRPHRVHVQAAEGPATPRFRTAPRESTDVFREALIENPLGAPLCAGPIDVFLDGGLVTNTEITAVDRGGVFTVGLGVEERLRIARNARIEESSAGLLGGSTHVDHHVTVDVTSSLGMPVNIEVLERIPVTDDKDVSIKVTTAEPEPETYDQSDSGAPIRGGRRFRVDVAAGGKAKVAYSYRIKLPAKNEIVGGNRRE
jgi:hypothetical protein